MSSEHENTPQNVKSGQEVAKHKSSLATLKHHPKTDARYWQEAVYFPTYTRDGETLTAGEYSARMMHAGRREAFSLGTSNKTAAAAKAKEIYLSLQSAGWEATLAKFKPKASKIVTTVGEFLEEVKAKADGRARTISDYCKAFRTIVAGVFHIDGGKEKYDYRTGGRERWLEKVHSVKLANLDPAKVQKWKIEVLNRAGDDPVKQRTAKISFNSTLRQAKCLFAPGVLKFIQLDLPGTLPFDGVAFEPRSSMRYRSSFDVETLIGLACDGDPEKKIAPLPNEQKKIFLLAVMAGLRRNEIDKLEWAAFRWNEGTIRIETTRYITPKSEDSAGDVEVDAELMALFKGFHAKAKGHFVIQSSVAPRLGVDYNHYRCQRDFAALTKWLREHGVTGNRPLHTLRKEFGSQLCAKHGIYAASHALRHADIGITSQHYLDSRKRATVGLGQLLKKPDNVIEITGLENGPKEAKTTKKRRANK
jgi:integrase